MTSPSDPTVVALTLQMADVREMQAKYELRLQSLEQADSKEHKPTSSVRWWYLTDEEREAEIGKLRGWERDILLPILGYHMLPCWPLHLAACVRMEVMCELWMTLWLGRRTAKVLSSQADYLVRYLPALADDIKSICSGCEHAKPAVPKQVA